MNCSGTCCSHGERVVLILLVLGWRRIAHRAAGNSGDAALPAGFLSYGFTLNDHIIPR